MLKYFTTVFLISITLAESVDLCPNYGPYCSCTASNSIMSCSGFDKFSQLDFNKGSTNNIFYELELNPNAKIMLDDTLNLDGIVVTNNVKLYQIKGFVFAENPFKKMGSTNNLSLFLFETDLEFYLKKGSDLTILNSIECKSSNEMIANPSISTIFSSFVTVTLSTGINYPSQMCPYIFKNTNLRFLTFELIDNVPTKININFVNINPNENTILDINSNVNRLNLYNFNLTYLNTAILNKNVFKNVQSLIIDYCNLDDIEETLFSSFKSLKYLRLQLSNFDSFMYNPSNKGWMKYLNGDIRVNLNNQTEIDANKDNQMLLELANRYEDDSEYVYWDEEVFKFQFFPHDKLVFPKIFSKDNLKCSITLRWLLKYWRNYNDFANINTIAVQKCLQLIEVPDQIVTITTTTSTRATTPSSSHSIFCKNHFQNLIILFSFMIVFGGKSIFLAY